MERISQQPDTASSSKRLNDAMKRLGYNNSTLSQLVEVHRNTVSNWRRGLAPIPRAVLLMLEERVRNRDVVNEVIGEIRSNLLPAG